MEDCEAGTVITSGIIASADRADTGETILETLYDQYAHALFRYALALVSSVEDAEDAVQEVFARIARELKHLRKVRNMKAYLFAATRNAAYSILRRRRSRNELSENDCVEFEALSTGEPGRSLDAIALRECFAKLPIEQREALVLKVFDGMTFEEIAQAVGVSTGTAASRYRYGLDKLRRALKEDDNE